MKKRKDLLEGIAAFTQVGVLIALSLLLIQCIYFWHIIPLIGLFLFIGIIWTIEQAKCSLVLKTKIGVIISLISNTILVIIWCTTLDWYSIICIIHYSIIIFNLLSLNFLKNEKRNYNT